MEQKAAEFLAKLSNEFPDPDPLPEGQFDNKTLLQKLGYVVFYNVYCIHKKCSKLSQTELRSQLSKHVKG